MSDYKLVPTEPTAEMVSEGARYLRIMSLPEREAAFVFRAMLAAAPAVQGEQAVESSVIAGALFDFIGFLTTRDKNTTFGATSLATPAVDLLSQWAETRKLHLDGADVKGWQDRICKAPQAPAAPDVQGVPVGVIRHVHYHGIARNSEECEVVLYDNAKNLPEGAPLYAAPQPAEQQPTPDVASLVEALEEARHHVVISPDPVRGGFIQEIDDAIAAYRRENTHDNQ